MTQIMSSIIPNIKIANDILIGNNITKLETPIPHNYFNRYLIIILMEKKIHFFFFFGFSQLRPFAIS
jgi:hypothetical protein